MGSASIRHTSSTTRNTTFVPGSPGRQSARLRLSVVLLAGLALLMLLPAVSAATPSGTATWS